MFKNSTAFSSFSVNDLGGARKFYGDMLGLDIKEVDGMLMLNLAGGGKVVLYAKDDHEPATFTVLNFPVDNIESAVEELQGKGVRFEHYEGLYQDERGVGRGKAAGVGPDIAWFKDPAGNILAVLEE